MESSEQFGGQPSRASSGESASARIHAPPLQIKWYCIAIFQYRLAIYIYFHSLAVIARARYADRGCRHVAAHRPDGETRLPKKATPTFCVAAAVGQNALRTSCKFFAKRTRSNVLNWRDFIDRSEDSIPAAGAPMRVRCGDPSEGYRHPFEHSPFPVRTWPRPGSRHRPGS